MEKVCSSKRDAAFTSSPPTEFVMYDHLNPRVISHRRLTEEPEPWDGTYSPEVYVNSRSAKCPEPPFLSAPGGHITAHSADYIT